MFKKIQITKINPWLSCSSPCVRYTLKQKTKSFSGLSLWGSVSHPQRVHCVWVDLQITGENLIKFDRI